MTSGDFWWPKNESASREAGSARRQASSGSADTGLLAKFTICLPFLYRNWGFESPAEPGRAAAEDQTKTGPNLDRNGKTDRHSLWPGTIASYWRWVGYIPTRRSYSDGQNCAAAQFWEGVGDWFHGEAAANLGDADEGPAWRAERNEAVDYIEVWHTIDGRDHRPAFRVDIHVCHTRYPPTPRPCH